MFSSGLQKSSSPSSRFALRPWLHLTVIALLGILSYANSFEVPLQFDDGLYIDENPAIKRLSNFVELPDRNASEVHQVLRNRYIAFLTLGLNYYFHALDVRGYHAVNLLIHVLGAFMVYALALLSMRTPRMEGVFAGTEPRYLALLAALVFVAHPVQTQAVTYISQRFASLAALFYLAAMVCYAQARMSPGRFRWAYYAAALASAVLAMKSKETAATLPAALVLYEFVFFKGPTGRRIARLVPFALTAALIPLSMADFGRPLPEALDDMGKPSWTHANMSRTAYLVTQFRVVVTYLRLLVLPVNQNLDYDYPRYASLSDGAVLVSLLILVALAALAVLLLRRGGLQRLAGFGMVLFFLALAVESSIIPIADVIYEHRMYLPMAGASMALSALMMLSLHRLRTRRVRMAVVAVLAAVPLVLGALTYERNNTWRSRMTLWEDVVRKGPGAPRAYVNLGFYYSDELKDREKAIRYYREALRLDPRADDARINLGIVYLERNELDKARYHLGIALKYYPQNTRAHCMMGVALGKMGQLDRAIEHLDTAIRVSPVNHIAYYNRGLVFANIGRYAEAARDLRKTIALNPDFAEAYNDLGKVYYAQGRPDLAMQHFRKALRLDPEISAETYNNLGSLLGIQGEIAESIDHFKEAVRLDPQYKQARLNLANALLDLGRPEQARAELERVLATDPANPKALRLMERLPD